MCKLGLRMHNSFSGDTVQWGVILQRQDVVVLPGNYYILLLSKISEDIGTVFLCKSIL
jgi:hypothetical protein